MYAHPARLQLPRALLLQLSRSLLHEQHQSLVGQKAVPDSSGIPAMDSFTQHCPREPCKQAINCAVSDAINTSMQLLRSGVVQW
jgi:hypothetical protein